MSPFAALGVGEDADERSVKRAYAQRLRSTRPDVDPEGFQALNGAYKAALAAIRWRARETAVEASAAPPASPEPSHADLPAPSESPAAGWPAMVESSDHAPELRDDDDVHVAAHGPPLVSDPPSEALAPVTVPENLFDYAATRADGGIEFDFDAFSADLFAVTADPAADLGAWLTARMVDWPLAMKPTLAPYVLSALDDEGVAIAPDHLAAIVSAFGLDDVLSGVDPLAIEQLRKANLRRWTRHEGAARGRRLLARENRKELRKAMRGSRYLPFVAPAIARMLTSRHAARWAVLRWFPPMARRVTKMLRYISADAVDALSPPIDPRVLAKWQRAERSVGRIRVRYVVIGFIVLNAIVGGIIAQVQSDGEQRARDRIAAIWSYEGTMPKEAVEDYAAFIADHPLPRSAALDDSVATAMFNRSIVLAKMGKGREAEDGYRALDEAFGQSQVPGVRLLVAKGLNNWAFLLAERRDWTAVPPVSRRVAARYEGAQDEYLGNDSLDVQVAKALINEANALEHTMDRLGTLAVCRDFLSRFQDSQTDEMRRLVATVRDIEGDYRIRTIEPQKGPFSLVRPPGPPRIDLPK